MPVFHFNLADHAFEHDPEGTELEDGKVARVEAIRFAGAYLADHPELLKGGHSFEVQVTDENGTAVCTVVITARDGP